MAADVVTFFQGLDILTPNRGRFDARLHLSFLHLQGQDFNLQVQYHNIARLYLLPQDVDGERHTYVVITFKSPIHQGDPHIVIQFESRFVVEKELAMDGHLLNTVYGHLLDPTYKGYIPEVFTLILRGLSRAKVTRPGKFRTHQMGLAVKAMFETEDGLLYPLEREFFFLPKPPTLLVYDEIDYVEFEKHGAAGTSMDYFDLQITPKHGQQHVFRNICQTEYANVFNFISGKGLKVIGVAEVCDAVDFHLDLNEDTDRKSNGEYDELADVSFMVDELESLIIDEYDSSSYTDDSGEDKSDASIIIYHIHLDLNEDTDSESNGDTDSESNGE